MASEAIVADISFFVVPTYDRKLKIGRGALGVGHWAWGIGHGALGMGENSSDQSTVNSQH
ncbi:hypothetical protein VF14_13170 [Nostoc linckia z18]|uniref:Uncharacterized protein n=2 Tax=Nostoc linckia TaxID=92942 RepID=A0A9Q5ZCU8_NOSLI|nr:hypothetical protein VF02_16240 [Nostoc linckia z1]PHJ66824.1 hypothetical protein VF05_18330 [Nostoc linckia z3]PHJ70238.1 hypothetical protein VF03_22480 [Nostoc linckia z2]PHJ79501.1 hypothetical protein VF06_25600 [Nostoc linckia z4]PHJ84303.1 hypothetical protein VF07_25555 [Nostoc linckia z6]PHJ96672.1 hypothetical protein VF04_15120 [Nostoc linckia z7]PHK03971.1 hypothetical protein VF08_12975 [Nostoc linckia z8]PHK08877.1 hypothetical protein VF09_18130 [Nostoc linckia z9]PHK2072